MKASFIFFFIRLALMFCRCSEELFCSHRWVPWGPVYPANDAKKRMGGGTAYGSASYIKEATRCAVIHCQFALFVSCNPSCLPTLPGDSAAVTKAPVWFLPQVRPLWNLLLMSYYTVSTAKLAFYFGMGFLLSAMGRAVDWVHKTRQRYHLQHLKRMGKKWR